MKKAILVVSFGTTYDDSRRKTIGAIENRIKREYPDYAVERAFTSNIVRKKLKERNIIIKNVDEALSVMINNGFEKIYIQPTHIISGHEYEKIINTVKSYKNVVIGRPLLYNDIDYKKISDFINRRFSDYEGSVVLMGHGSDHNADKSYSKLQTMLNDNIYIATVEGQVTLDDIIPNISSEKVLLTPFMIVCGDHANNDMSVEWKETLEENGFTVELLLKGLGEYSEIQNMFSEHIKGEI